MTDAGSSKSDRAAGVERMLDGDEAPNPETPNEPGAASSAPGAENVADQDTQRGEDVSAEDGKEAGREDAGTQGATDRPVGTSNARDTTGVNPQEPITGTPAQGGQGG